MAGLRDGPRAGVVVLARDLVKEDIGGIWDVRRRGFHPGAVLQTKCQRPAETAAKFRYR
jgi:hypothetical protein